MRLLGIQPRSTTCAAINGAAIRGIPLRVGLNLSARAGAGIDKSFLTQAIERRTVKRYMLGLFHNRLVTDKTEPPQIVQKRLFETRQTPLRIDILDTNQELALHARKVSCVTDRSNMTEMQKSGRARRKTCVKSCHQTFACPAHGKLK